MSDIKTVRVESYLQTTQSETEAKKYNIYIGISLGNRYFTKQHVRAYIYWALAHTKEDVAILIADEIHAINLHALKNYSAEKALHSALQAGNEIANMVQTIINGLPGSDKSLVQIVHWSDIKKQKDYQERLAIIQREFVINPKFREKILHIVKETFEGDVPFEKLAEYVICELPLFLFGLLHSGKSYTLLPYPGLTAINELVVEFQQGTTFSDIAKKLGLKEKTAFVEAYVE